MKRQSTRRKSNLSDSSTAHNVYEVEPVVIQKSLEPIHRSQISNRNNQQRTSLWREVKTFKETCSTRMELVILVTKAVVKDGMLILM